MNGPLETLRSLLHEGGFVMPPLAFVSLLLWYALGARAFTLRGHLRRAAEQRLEQLSRGSRNLSRPLLDDALFEFVEEAGQLRRLVRGLVTVAPLLGLLGTVSGMIETFDALADMALFTQSGGVAGGVSQALLTTQVGLTVAVPGLLLGRALDRRERRIIEDFEKMKDRSLLRGAP
ncbi:MAG: MotA/TolQ/ExbB proton channel family protein [Myxococcota bacterium]